MLGREDIAQRPKEPEKPPREQTTAEPTPSVDMQKLDRLQIARALRLDSLKDMEKHAHRLDKLAAWARSKGAKNEVDVTAEIASLRNRLGSPTIHDLLVYISLQSEQEELLERAGEVSKKMSKFHA